ncbi:MAG: PKD domain-containing protein, partial [Candidatus Thermoplasmatota archaeon]
NYTWDFGDGSFGFGIVVSHSYLIGKYNVVLVVIDNDGGISTASILIDVLKYNEKPVSIFDFYPKIGFVNEPIYFNASNSYDIDGYIEYYFWDFGDGSFGFGISTTHIYKKEGIYEVRLRVVDNGRKESESTKYIEIKKKENILPIANAGDNKLTYVFEKVYFESFSVDIDGYIVNCTWSFGDGSYGYGELVWHIYEKEGNYTVLLTVEDNEGGKNSTSIFVVILQKKLKIHPGALIFSSSLEAYTLEEIIFESKSYDDGIIVLHRWSFGDGETKEGRIVNKTYVRSGVYIVVLYVIDNEGLSNSTYIKVFLRNRLPIPIIKVEPMEAYTCDEIIFESLSFDYDGNIVSYYWNFGDGKSSEEKFVKHSFTYPGNYTIVLYIIDDNGAKNKTNIIMKIKNRAPIPYIGKILEWFTNKKIEFNANSSYDPDGVIINYTWDFGDGEIGYGIIAQHIYKNEGKYLVKLKVKDEFGVKNETSINITIKTEKIEKKKPKEEKFIPGFEILLIIIAIVLVCTVARKA